MIVFVKGTRMESQEVGMGPWWAYYMKPYQQFQNICVSKSMKNKMHKNLNELFIKSSCP